MTTNEGLADPELQRVLWACLAYWNSEPSPIEKRMVCYSWVLDCYRARFGSAFHKSVLEKLARFGWLEKMYTVRGGDRRYYRIKEPARLSELLRGCDLN